MELLVVVALLAVIVAIAAPNLYPIVRSTEITRLDNYAKEIYVAVQNQFVGMEPTGEYKQFNDAVKEASSRNLGNLRAQPSDSLGADWYNYYYLTSYGTGLAGAEGDADNALAQVMGRTSALEGILGKGRYIVEVNPRSDGTDVYSVFYSEDPDFTYDDVVALASREQGDRMNDGRGYPVGYYSASSNESGDVPDHFVPRARFVNGEELFLNVSCPGASSFVGAESGMKVVVTITDGAATETLEYTGGEDFHLDVNGNVDFDLLLDSMREGFALADVLPSMQAGADLRATVDVTFTGVDGTTIVTPIDQRGQARANSLFASNVDGIVEVGNVRHLHNLSLARSSIVSVAQVSNIDFDARTWGGSERTQLSRVTKDYNSTEYVEEFVNPLDLRTDPSFEGFAPIASEEGDEWSYDGRGNTLSNFYIVGEGSTGLFSHVRPNQSVSNVVLVDTVVEGHGATGALVGTLEGRVVSCGARLNIASDADSHKQSTCLVHSDAALPVGGLVGESVGGATIEGSYAAVDVAGPASDAVGGLVGSVNGGAVSTSYSSGVVDAGGIAGGLVGSARSTAVQNCYSTSDIGSASLSGGLLGEIADSSVAECVSYGRVSTAGGGFVGNWAGTDFTSCLYLRQRSYNDALADQPDGVEGQGMGSLASPVLGSDHSHPYRESLMGSAFPFKPVLDEHWGNWPSPSSMRPVMLYYERYGDGSYGYFGTGYDETGDVVLNTLDETLVVVEDGYALLSPNVISGFDYTLNAGTTYRATLGEQPASGVYVELPTKSDSAQYASESSEEGASEGEVLNYLYYWLDDNMVPLEGFHVYQLPVDLLMPSRNASSVYDTLQLQLAEADGLSSEEYLFYYNPDLAKMAVSPEANGQTPAPANPDRLLVRTARQLNRVGYEPYYWNSTIAQDRDIDFGYYGKTYAGHNIDYMVTSGEYANCPIGVPGRPFQGTFDGQNHVIIDYALETSGIETTGLFGCVSGTVRDVHLASSSMRSVQVSRTGAAVGNTPAVGALVGLVDGGTVSGCSVSGYRVSFASSGNVSAAAVGGLVGINLGSVVRSSAANIEIASTAPSSSGAQIGMGGLVGANGAAVMSCYAVENDLSIRTTTSGSGRQLNYGGIAGTTIGSSASVGNSYAWLYARNTATADGDNIAYYGVANTDATDVYRCCYLDVDEPYEDGDAVAVCSPGELQNYAFADFANGTQPRFTYGETMSGHVVQQASNYPYPVVCKDAYGDYAHYGFDWRE